MSAATNSSNNQAAFVWFRIGDLRITDHEPLHHAISSANSIIPFFCLDERLLQPLPDSLLHLPANGPYRLAAILEAVHSLRLSLQELGSDLITSTGNTPEALEQLVNATAATSIAAAAAAAAPPSHITLHYYPSLVDFNGKLGSHFEKEVTDKFLQAAAAQGISATVQPCTVGSGGGTSLLYLPEDIHAIHSTKAGTACENTTTTTDTLQTVVELLEQKASMTDFRKVIQTTTPIRRPLPPPLEALPPLPPTLLTHLDTTNDTNSGLIKPLECIKEDSMAWQEYYTAAGAEDALKNLEDLVFVDNGSNSNTFSPAVVDKKRIDGRVVKVQRPPITEQQVQERLDRLFNGGSGGGSGGSGGPPLMDTYRTTRMTASNSLETSAMLSIALSLGTLSIRTLYWKTLEAMLVLENKEDGGGDEENNKINSWQWSEPTKESPGHHWLLMHLVIRDFFTYYAIKSALSLENSSFSLRSFDASGPQMRKDLIWSTDRDILSSWARGQTGFPFVDASMRELAHTGWCSNRGRQNVASFLSKALNIDWRLGEEIFASLLLDHNFAVNWASWAYIAGVGADPRDRLFKTVTQGEKYDPEGEYIAEWVPENLVSPPLLRHRPWERQSDDGNNFSQYPKPIIDPSIQIGKGPPPSKEKC